ALVTNESDFHAAISGECLRNPILQSTAFPGPILGGACCSPPAKNCWTHVRQIYSTLGLLPANYFPRNEHGDGGAGFWLASGTPRAAHGARHQACKCPTNRLAQRQRAGLPMPRL